MNKFKISYVITWLYYVSHKNSATIVVFITTQNVGRLLKLLY